MLDSEKINAIVHFVSRHPQSTASRRICREVLGEARERIDQEFADELTANLSTKEPGTVESYYYLIR